MQHIEKPITGWSCSILKTYGINFYASVMTKSKACLELIESILNKYLNYFDIDIDKSEIIIIIDDIMNDKIKEASLATQIFKQNILDYSGVIYSNGYRKVLLSKYQEEQMLIKRQAKKIKKLDNNNGGIYGIYSINNTTSQPKLLYIGYTDRAFEERWKEHQSIVVGTRTVPDGMHKLYNLLKQEYQNGTVFAKALIDFNKIQVGRPLYKRDKEAMELALITLLKPPGNTAGIDVPYPLI